MPEPAAFASPPSKDSTADLPHPYPEDDGSRVFELLVQARVKNNEDDYAAAISLCATAIEESQSISAPLLGVAALCLQANAYSSAGLSNEALACASQALEKAQELGDQALEARALFSIALIALDTNDEAEAHGLLDRSLVCAQAVSSPYDIFWAHNNLSHIYGEKAERLADGDDPVALSHALASLLENATKAMQAAWRTGEWLHRCYALLNLAKHFFLTKQNHDAREMIAQYTEIAQQNNSPRLSAYANLDEARLLSSEGETVAAIELLSSKMHMDISTSKLDLSLQTQEALARLNKECRRFEQAYAHLENARALEREIQVFKTERQVKMMSARIEVQEARSIADRLRSESELLEWRNSMLEKEREMLRLNAMLDTLTGLGNRRAAEAAIERRLENAAKGDEVFQLAYIDVDHFKSVNDRFGHGVGDAVLGAIGQLLKSGLRDLDEVFRFGGEEFVLLVSGNSDQHGGQVCERLRASIERHKWAQIEPDLVVTASFGVTTWRDDLNADAVLARADTALYEAKNKGRNRVVSV